MPSVPRLSSALACLVLASASLAAGCASYVTPGRAADLSLFGGGGGAGAGGDRRAGQTDRPVQTQLDRQPLARFPSALAVVRVQQAGYASATAEGWGAGRYSIVTTRDIEQPRHFERLARLPLVLGVAPLNRLLLPRELTSDQELRQAAGALHADLLLIYTMDTTFNTDELAPPLTVLSLGLLPNQTVRVNSTASALLMDSRNGYLYAVAEATSRQSQLASAWTNNAAVDAARRQTESEAFDKLMTDFERAWGQVINQYGQAAAGR